MLALVGCAPEESLTDAARRNGLCEGKCDGVRADGALTVSKTWVPDDGFVRARAGADETIAVIPMTGVSIQPAGRNTIVRFSEEGFFEVQSRDGDAITGRVKVRVSDDGPVVELAGAGGFYPLTGAPVRVTGTARDPLGAPLRLTLDGETLPVEGGAFAADVDGRFGINAVSLAATDAADNRFVFSRAFLAAPSFGTGAQPVVTRIGADGLATLVSGLRPILPRLIQIPILTTPVRSYLGNDIYLDEVLLPGQGGQGGTMDLALTLRTGSLHATLTTDGDVSANGRIDWLVGGVSDYDAVLHGLRVELDLRFVTTNGALDVVAESVVVTLSGIELHVEHIPDWLLSIFSSLIKGVLADTVEEQIPQMIRVLLVALEGTVPVEVPVPGNPVSIQLSYGVKTLVPTTSALTIGLDARAHGPEVPAGEGAPLRAEARGEPPTDAPFGVALGYNLFNQVSFTLWKANAFAIHLDEEDLAAVLAEVPEIEIFHPTIDVDARLGLPAVAEPVGDELQVSIGELRTEIFLTTDLFQVTLKATVSARADVDVSVAAQRLHADLTVTEIHVDLERSAFAGLDPESVERFVEALAPVLVDVVEARLGDLPLPWFDLAAAGFPEIKVGLESATVRATANAIAVSAELKLQ